MSVNAYKEIANGDNFGATAYNQVTTALGRVDDDSLNPIQGPDYIIWLDSAVYYAKNGRTGAVTSSATCHTLVNGLIDTNKWIHFAGGSDYVLTGALDLASYTSVRLTGNPRRGSALQPADTINAIELDEAWWCTVDGFKIDGVNQTTSGMGVKFTEATATNYAQRNTFKNIEFSACYQGIGDLNTTTNAGSNNTFQDLNFVDCTLTDIDLSLNGTGLWKFSRVLLDHVGTPATGQYCMTLSNADGIHIDGLTILTGGATSLSSMLIEDSTFIWMSNIDAEKAGQDLFRFDNCNIANISNIRGAESGMDAGGGDSNLELNGCRDFNINNFFFGTSTGAGSEIVNISIDGATESNRIKFSNGNISGSTAEGARIEDASTYIKFIGVDFFSNTAEDVDENNTTNYNTYKGCTFQSGNDLQLIGDNNVYDQFITAPSVIDLSGGATDIDVFYAQGPCALAGYLLWYTEASSPDVDWPAEAVRIGRTQDGVANDPDYFDETISEASQAIGYRKHFYSPTLTNQYIADGDTVTVGTAGGKTGAGEIRVILAILENAS